MYRFSSFFLRTLFVIFIFSATETYASQADWLLGELSARFPVPEKIQYKDPSGTMMKGKLAHLIYDGRDLGELSWVLDPKAFASGKIAVDIRLGKGSPFHINATGRLETGMDQIIHIKDLKASMPAVYVLDLARRPRFYEPQGELTLNVRSGTLVQEHPFCETLDGTLVWSGAKIALSSGKYDADNIRAELGCRHHEITLKTHQASAQFNSESDIILKSDSRYEFTGWLDPGRRLSEKMRRKLTSLGKIDSAGKIQLSGNGKL